MQLTHFRVTNYRNIVDSGEIDVGAVTAFVGQNEAGKSNLFEALSCINSFVPTDAYNIDEDWPVDDWSNKDAAALVCEARFRLTGDESAALYMAAGIPRPAPATPAAAGTGSSGEETTAPSPAPPQVLPPTPDEVVLLARRTYSGATTFDIVGAQDGDLQGAKVTAWVKKAIPKFVYIRDYGLSGAQVELDALASKIKNHPDQLTNEEQTIKIILDLARINIDDFLQKGTTPEGRTIRSFDKRSASAYLSKQFQDLWRQKKVNFDIEIDGPTLNIFARDEAVGMPVRLHRRSSGFRWHVSFAWKFTHASKGQYQDCILLLEEPGIHLHYSGQRDLLEVFERLSSANTILYTTHLASMIDLANPERVRIVESRDNHSVVKKGVVSSQRAPAAVIEIALGLTGGMSGLLGTRQTLIVEGGDEALLLQKVSGILRDANKPHLAERIYLWPAHGASNTPMYAAMAAGHGWDSGVLLDSDDEGRRARKKIDQLVLKDLATENQAKFRVLMLGDAAGINQTDAAIEDLLDPAFYLECVNATFGFALQQSDFPVDGSDMITKRIEFVVTNRFGHKELDRRRVMKEVLRRFDQWKKIDDLPLGTAEKATRLFRKIDAAFGS